MDAPLLRSTKFSHGPTLNTPMLEKVDSWSGSRTLGWVLYLFGPLELACYLVKASGANNIMDVSMDDGQTDLNAEQ